MYIRFVTTQIDSDSHKPQGLFVTMSELLEQDDLSQTEREQLKEVEIWFNKNLPSPGKSFNARRAIFWYKQRANNHINKMWELANLLRLHGYFIEVQKCHRVVNIIFEDDFQVAAYSSKDDGK